MKYLSWIFALAILSTPAWTGDKPPSDADAEGETCETDANSYAHGALTYFHSMLCVGNRKFAGMAEEVFYHLVVDMGLDVSTDTLAADGSTTALTAKTFNGKAITGTANKIVASDTFFGVYDYRAEVSVDGTKFMDVRWSGKGKASKGYLVMIPRAMKSGTEKGLVYIRWDRVDSTAQTISALVTRFATSYLAAAATDRAMYYKANFNDTTKVATVQAVSIEQKRSNNGTFGCFTMYGDGTMGGAIRVGKTKDSLNMTGHLTTYATKVVGPGLDWDDCEATDTKTYANGSGNGTTVDAFTFNYSCNDVTTTTAFAGNTVDFTLTKTQVDAMFP